MPEAEAKKLLTDLVSSSQTLEQDKKNTILQQMDTLSREQADKLTNILLTEKRQLQKIDEKYRPQEVDLKKKYLETLTTFEKSDMHEALAAVEENSEDKDQTLKNILKKMDEPKKKKPRILMLFITLVVLGIVYYLLVYQFKIIHP